MKSWSLGLLLACLALTRAARLGDFLSESSSHPRAADLAHARSLLMKGATNVAADRFYPYYVQIYDFDPAANFNWYVDTVFTKFNIDDLKTKCGGVMIPPPTNGTYSYVLTAASCVAAKANPIVVVGATKTDYAFRNARKPSWNSGSTVLPIIRTVYASYPHDSWNKVPGSEYDFALLLLDAQAPPYVGSECGAQCVGMSTARAPDGTTLSSVGQGSAASNSFTAAAALQELAFKTISTDACNTARGLPAVNPSSTFQGLRKWWQQHFTAGAVTNNQLCATATTQAAGLCRLDAGNPLVSKGTAPSGVGDQLYGVGSQIMESCNSQADPSVFTDISKVATWVQSKQKSLSPVVDKNGNLVASSLTAKPLYNYAMKIKFVDKTTGADVGCGNAESGLSVALGAGPMAQVWSQWVLSKGFFDPVSATSYKLHREQNKPNPFAVQVVSCTAGVVKFEWTSSKNYATMKSAMDAALLPANVAGWSDGARYWAVSMMCETNMGANFLGFPAYFEISTGKGAWKRFLASDNNGRYLVDRTGTIPNYGDASECGNYRNDLVPAGGQRRRSAF